ncbi:MAG: hypothetical protein OXF93_04630 [Acidobacteria bacterium]|nr:hypothetical protein [Acidobacteriota bacterium]
MPRPSSAPSSSSNPSQQDLELQERVSKAFGTLASSAAELNTVSDELAVPIRAIDAVLQKLNLGVSEWVPFWTQRSDEHEYVQQRSLGYGKISGDWGLAIRTYAGFYADDQPSVEEWLFNDAPRSYRLEAVEKIPDLLDALSETARKTTQDLKAKVALTQQVSTTINRMAPSNPKSK